MKSPFPPVIVKNRMIHFFILDIYHSRHTIYYRTWHEKYQVRFRSSDWQD